MARRAGALFRSLCRLQIGAEVARAFDDFFVLSQSPALEPAQRRFYVFAVERFGKRGGIIRRLGHAGGDMRPRHKGGIADNRHPSKSEMRTLKIIDRL